MRICSLLPSATDIVLALGLGDRLVAVTHECDLPPGLRKVPVITQSGVDQGQASSREIHNHVTAAAHSGSSIYTLDQALLERLEPDLILTQELCDVCAISYEEVAKAVHRLDVALAATRTVLSLEPQTLAGILEAIEQVGAAAGVARRAAGLVGDLRARIDRVATIANGAASRPRVFAMEWLDPPYTAGHWVPEMIRLAGGRDELSREGEYSVEVSWARIAEYDPDVLVLMPCSFSLARTLDELSRLALPDVWPRLKAVASGDAYAVDSATYFSRSSPRTIEGLEMLAEILHPKLFARMSAPGAWQRITPAERR